MDYEIVPIIKKYCLFNNSSVEVICNLTILWDRDNPPNTKLPHTSIERTLKPKKRYDILTISKIDPFKEWGDFQPKFIVKKKN